MKDAGLIGGQFLIGVLARMVADDGGEDWVSRLEVSAGQH